MSAGGAVRRQKVEKPASTRLLLLVLCSAVFVSVLNSSMVNVVVPVIGRDFRATEPQVGWVITGFLLMYAIAIPLYGRVSDFYSLKNVYALGLAIFAAGSLINALSPSLSFLVAGRVVQAAGAAAVPALGAVAVTKALPPGERGVALGLLTSSVGLGAAVGPVVGGFVEAFSSWHYLFYGSLALALVLIPGSLYVLPEGEPSREGRFDLAGGVLLGLAAGLFLFGITQGQVAGFKDVTSWGSFAGAALSGAGFVLRIVRAPHPFVSPKLFENREYVVSVVLGFFAMLANVSTLVMVPLLISGVNNLSSGAAGLVLSPGAIAVAVLSPTAGRLSDRIGVRIPLVAGLVLMIFCALFISTFGAGASPYLVALGMLGFGAGFAFVNPTAVNAAAGSLPQEEVGVGLGIFQGAFFLGGGAGPAIVGAFLAARQESASSALNPLYSLKAAPFSDAFLLISASALISLLFALRLGNKPEETACNPGEKEVS